MTTEEKTKARKAKTTRKSLAAPIDDHGPGISSEVWYWIGALPQCTGEGLDIGGMNFPKINEDVKPAGIGGKTTRIPRIGALVKLNQDRVELIEDKLSRCVLRFTEPADEDQQNDAEDYTQRRRKGYPIRIPTEEQVKAGSRRYVRGTHDEPAARYLFAQVCADQNNPVRGNAYPDNLEDAPELLAWPDGAS
jgi:hypothetical protein